MTVKRQGVSADLLIPPGETIEDLLAERRMTRTELAVRIGVSSAYLDGVISGQEAISPDFAAALERVFNAPQSFWLNLQAKFDAERMVGAWG